MSVELRRATSPDVAAIKQLVADAYGKYVERIGVPPMPDLHTNEAMTENIALYSRIGYVEVGRTLVTGRRRVSMRKQL